MRRICILFVVVAVAVAGADAQVFTLDDNPINPINPPPYPGVGMGAEDPFGVGLVPPPGFGGSPSLAVIPAIDGDILTPGVAVPVPALHMFSPNGWSVDAISTRKDRGDVVLDFSVDRLAMGMAGTGVSGEAMVNQQPGDIYRATPKLPDPGQFVNFFPPFLQGYVGALPSAGFGGGNQLLIDESQLTLTAVGLPGALVPPGVLTPPPVPGQPLKDNVDGFDWPLYDVNGDQINDKWVYFSVNPDEAVASGVSAADIFDVAPQMGSGIAGVPFAPALSMGLDRMGPNTDDIDALVLWDWNILGGPAWESPGGIVGPGGEQGIDYALFSLSPGSASLAQFGLSPSEIFFTDFSGWFATYAFSSDIGLLPDDNVDAAVPEPATLVLLMGGLPLLSRLRRKRT